MRAVLGRERSGPNPELGGATSRTPRLTGCARTGGGAQSDSKASDFSDFGVRRVVN